MYRNKRSLYEICIKLLLEIDNDNTLLMIVVVLVLEVIDIYKAEI